MRMIQSNHTTCLDSCLGYQSSGMLRTIITTIVNIVMKIKWIFTLLDLLDIGLVELLFDGRFENRQ